MYRVEVRWSPAFELFTSLGAYISRRNHAIMDLGTSWAKEVRRSLQPELASRLTETQLGPFYHLAHLAIIHHRDDVSPEQFLDWFSLRPLEELNDYAVQAGGNMKRYTSADLLALRDEAVDVLGAWNEAYFRHVDPAVLDGLGSEAVARKEMSARMSPVALVEEATNGVCFEPRQEPDVVLLVPQWHFRPWNVYTDYDSQYVYMYPADVLPLPPDEPPLALLRVSRALGDESRLRILRSLAEGPRSFTDLVKLTGLSKSTVNHHMVVLRAAGLVTVHEQLSRGPTYTPRLGTLDEFGIRARAYLKGGNER